MPTILIVDDDPMVLESTKAYLETQGLKVICAKDGNEAFKKLESEAIDIALIDINMPNQAELSNIFSLQNDIAVIAMTGAISHRFEPSSFSTSLGARLTLSKPFHPIELMDAINQLLNFDDK